MFRAALGLRATPLGSGAAHAVPAPAWQGVWRRFLGSETKQALSRCAQRQRSCRPQPLLRATARDGAKRPTVGISETAAGRRQKRMFGFSAWRRGTNGAGDKAQQKLSLGARLKKLSREYGWSAVGVYLGLSVLDFPFCFLLVRIVGTETIGKAEHYVASSITSMVPEWLREACREHWRSLKRADEGIGDKLEMAGWGVREAQERNEEEASLATQLALAYAIHKSFIFVRVPLTAAVTPKVVKVLRGWGWKIGKRGRG